MKPLATTQRVLTWYRICHANESTSSWKKILYTIFSVICLIANACAVVASATFLAKFISTDLEESLYALFQCAAYFNVVYIHIVAFLLRQKVTSVFDSLSEIYETKKSNADLFRFLAKGDDQSEYIWRFFFKIVIVGYVLTTISLSGVSALVSSLMNGKFDAKYAYHPHRLSLPWNQETPFGYFSEILFDITVGDAYLLTNGTLLLLLISMCLQHQSFCELFQHLLKHLDHPDKSRNDKVFICELIRFHVTVKNWFWDTAEVFSLIIVSQLVTSMIFSACVIFQMDLQLRHIGFDLGFLLIGVVTGASNLFFYCFFGKVATESYENISNSIFESNWLDLPVDLQKYFILMISNAQEAMFYHGFKVAILNLETFTKLLRAVITYYMMFKTLTK